MIAPRIALSRLVWWQRTAPAAGDPGRRVRPIIDRSTAAAIAAVDRSADFAAGLQRFPSDAARVRRPRRRSRTAPPRSLTGNDGGSGGSTRPPTRPCRFVDPPLMAYGIHEAPGDPDHLYFCASRVYGAGPGTARWGCTG